ncbi:protein-export membrane protein secG [Paenibacillus terrae HPL-003]|uniref:Protein-export membrane protein SecG n=2 Tax=Paenibacillus terrae TaxID=159743 RepID=G7VX66_PAETH|nr:protein-export membrane protein secG [Paenibacillus terrae HPL-003]
MKIVFCVNFRLFITWYDHVFIKEAVLFCKTDVLAQEVGFFMEIFLKVLLVVFSIAVIAVVLLQKGKSAGLSGAISGGAEHLFGKTKARGMDLILQRVTAVLGAGFMIVSVLVAFFAK